MNLQNVSDTPPTNLPEISEALEMLLPTERDDAVIRDEFALLVAQMMCGDIQQHIPHQYEQEMSSKSEVVSIIQLFGAPLITIN